MGLGLVDTFLAYKFIKMLATPFKKMDAYKLGIIDAKGKRIKSAEADEAVRMEKSLKEETPQGSKRKLCGMDKRTLRKRAHPFRRDANPFRGDAVSRP